MRDCVPILHRRSESHLECCAYCFFVQAVRESADNFYLLDSAIAANEDAGTHGPLYLVPACFLSVT